MPVSSSLASLQAHQVTTGYSLQIQGGKVKWSNPTTSAAAPPTSATKTADTGYFVKWNDGTKIIPASRFRTEPEGDGSRFYSKAYKAGQYGTGKVNFWPRPKEAIMLAAALCGNGSCPAPTAGSGTRGVGYQKYVVTPQTLGWLDPYTVTMNLADSTTSAWFMQMYDSVCNKVVLSATAQDPIVTADVDWVGSFTGSGTATNPGSFLTDDVFYFYSGTWTINSTLMSSAMAGVIQSITFTFDNQINVDDFMGEILNPIQLIAKNLKVSVDVTAVWQDAQVFQAAYYASTSGTADAQNIVTNQLQVSFQCASDTQGLSTAQTMQINIPNAALLPNAEFQPSKDGKLLTVTAHLEGLKPTGGTGPVIFTFDNSAATVAYSGAGTWI